MVRKPEFRSRLIALFLLIASVAVLLAPGGSCSRKGSVESAKLSENLYGLYLGETKGEVFARAKGVVTIKATPEPPREYRGELYNLSGPLETYPGIDHIRLAFLKNRLWEIIVYFSDTSVEHLNWLRMQLEGQYETRATSPDGMTETVYKTYRLNGPGMSITLRRITKKETTELYVQYIHDELHRELLEKGKGRAR